MIPLFKSNYDSREATAAKSVVESGWLSMGEHVQEFESQFSKMLGGSISCLATSNCTMSLYLAMLALDIGVGDEVLVPSLTFVADASVVRMCGATPVFVDINGPTDLNMSVADLTKKISKKTKACIVVHFGGFACAIDEITAVCKDKGIAVVEDCAHAPGATFGDRALGTFGEISCFSFYSNKNISTGEGGMVCSSDERIAKRLSQLRAHGMTRPTLDKKLGRTAHYDIIEPSLNCRLDEIRAAIGVIQLNKLEDGNAQRKAVFEHYSNAFQDTELTVPFQSHTGGTSAYHIMVVVLPSKLNRDSIMASLRDEGIQSSLHYRPFWSFTAYSDVDESHTPELSAIHQQLISIPLSPGFSTEEIDTVVNKMKDILARDDLAIHAIPSEAPTREAVN